MFVTLKLQILVCNCFNIKTDCWKKNGEYVVSSVGIEPALVEVQLTRPRVIYVFIGWQCPPTNYELNLNTDSFSSFKSSLFKYYESSLYLYVIMSMILVVIKLYVLSVILCVVSRHHYRAVCRNYSSVFAVVMCMLQHVM